MSLWRPFLPFLCAASSARRPAILAAISPADGLRPGTAPFASGPAVAAGFLAMIILGRRDVARAASHGRRRVVLRKWGRRGKTSNYSSDFGHLHARLGRYRLSSGALSGAGRQRAAHPFELAKLVLI